MRSSDKFNGRIAALSSAMMLCIAGLMTSAGATEMYVPDAYPTIQAALDASAAGDTIIVADGTYQGSGNRDINFMGKAVILRSESGPAKTIIDCEGSISEPHRGVIFDSDEGPSSVLEGFTIANANAEYGAGILCDGASPTIRNCVIKNSRARVGAGMICIGGPLVENCSFQYNRASYSGGSHGGGVYCYPESTVTITECEFLGNTALDYGGAVMCYDSSTDISNSTFSGNSAYSGGAIACYGSVILDLFNCSLNKNEAEFGAGVSLWGSELMAGNCTVADNRGQNGGGVFAYSASTASVTNSIFWRNTGIAWTDAAEQLLSLDSQVVAGYTCIQDSQPGDGDVPFDTFGTNMDSDPLFAPVLNVNEYALSQIVAGEAVNSPCLDAGSDTVAALGLERYSTRCDCIPDTGVVDLGYHNPYELIVSSSFSPSGDITLTWNAIPGVEYRVDTSVNLTTWVTRNVGATDQWVDTFVPGQVKFHRVREVSP